MPVKGKFQGNPYVCVYMHLTAHNIRCVQVTKRKAVAEDGDKPAKKAKATPTTNGASGSGTGAAVSEGPKKRGRPSNKEVCQSCRVSLGRMLCYCSPADP